MRDLGQYLEGATRVLSFFTYAGMVVLGRWGLGHAGAWTELALYSAALLVGIVGCIYVYNPEAFNDVREP